MKRFTVVAAGVVALAVFVWLDPVDRFFRWTRPYESFELDELLVLLVMTAVLLAIYGYRMSGRRSRTRNRDVRHQQSGELSEKRAVSRDVSERRSAEAERERLLDALSQSAAEWKETFDSVPSAILLCDGDGTLNRLNRAAEQALGRALDCRSRPALSEMGEGEPWRSLPQMLERVQASGTGVRRQFFDSDSGRSWDVEAALMGAGSSCQHSVIFVANDITKLEALSESVREKETMSALGALVAGVAHEIRNPLFGISATVDALEAKYHDQEELRRFLEILRQQLARMNNLTQQLFEYGRPFKTDLKTGSLKLLIEEAIST